MRTSRVAPFAAVLALLPCSASTASPGLPLGTVGSAVNSAPSGVSSPAQRAELAYRWAPIHRQNIDRSGSHSLGGRADYIARVDFDGDWDGRNNWQNAERFPAKPAVYYSVVESSTHWFVAYMFFHARDWARSVFDTEHENDAEGVLFAIERDGSPHGVLRAAVTVAHSDFYSFVPPGGTWRAGRESVDGSLEFSIHDGAKHPVTTQEARGHALKAGRSKDARHDALVYYPVRGGDVAEPSPGARRAPYVLIDIFEPGGLWERRDEPSLFAKHGTFAGDTDGGCGLFAIPCMSNAANAPWGWNDSDDGPVQRGDLARDPARLVEHYFRFPERLSRSYTHNPYLAPAPKPEPAPRQRDAPLVADSRD